MRSWKWAGLCLAVAAGTIGSRGTASADAGTWVDIPHSSASGYIGAGDGNGGTLSGSTNGWDSNDSTYTQALSNGDHIKAMTWYTTEEYDVSSHGSTLRVHGKVEASNSWQTHAGVYAFDWAENRWEAIIGGDGAPKGVIEATVALGSEYVDGNGKVRLGGILFAKHNPGVYARYYESSLEALETDTTPPTITAPADVVAECTGPDGQAVSLGTPTVSDDQDPDPAVTNDAPSLFHAGSTTVTWTATDAAGNSATDVQTVTVVDTTAPALTVSGLPDELWPANHKLVRITPSVAASDLCDAAPTVTLSVASSEPDEGLGDGDTGGDIVVHSPTDVELRAERSGAGNGRTYTLTWTATDAAGNAATATRVVTVPKWEGKGK